MRTFTFTVLFLCSFLPLFSQTLINQQYASSVIAFSSEYGGQYAASFILGPPNGTTCGSANSSWTPLTQDGPPEYITVGFSTPQPVNSIKIYQNYNPGAVSSVELRNAGTGTWTTVYTATPAADPQCIKILEITIPTTPYNVDALRINVDNNIPSWQYYDAVSIANYAVMNYQWDQFVGNIIGFSSQYGSVPNNWSAQEVLGPPNTNSCGDIATAWASSTQNGSAGNSREYIELGYTYPAHANRVSIYETNEPGAIDTVYLRDAATGTWHMIFSRTAGATPFCPNVLEINFTETTYNVDAVRIAMDISVPGWNEIDAVSLRSNLPAGAKFTTQHGAWSNPANWSGGTLPTANDTVIMGHNITLDMNATVKTVLISPGASLTIPSNTLTLGSTGGGKEILQVQGAVNVTGGTLAVNGHIEFLNGSTLNQSGGEILVDGNDGTDAGSVPNGIHLIDLKPGITVTVTGGTITVVDPQYHSSGQAISGNYTFGAASTFRIGNGTSTDAGNNTYGFGGPGTYPHVGNFVMDAVTGTGNRQFNPYNDFIVQGSAQLNSGTFAPSWNVNVAGNLTNNGNIVNASTFLVQGITTNNSSIITNSGSFLSNGDFINNATGSFLANGGSNTSFAEDLVNNGSFTTFSWLYMAHQFGPSTVPQTIGGTGTFNINGLDLINSNPAGITLLVPLTINLLYFEPQPAKLFLGNNDLTILSYTYGSPDNDAYVVLNGTGKVINRNINTGPVVIPVGLPASYTPVTIANGNGHDFAVFLRSTFTAPPPAPGVNREWDIADLTGGPVSATLTFQWNGSDEDPAFTRNLCRVAHYTGGTWTDVSPGGAATGSDPYMRTATGISSFSPFSVISGGTPLPVHLVQFDAWKENNRVRLSWKAEDESGMAQYVIERSADGRSFQNIGSVAAVNLAASHDYEWIDQRPLTGINYYRLRQVELDGSYRFSTIAKVDMKSKYTVHVYPNPASDQLYVQGIQQFEEAGLVDAQGRTIRVWKIISSDPLDLISISPGVYTLRLKTKDEILIQKIIISR